MGKEISSSVRNKVYASSASRFCNFEQQPLVAYYRKNTGFFYFRKTKHV